MPRRLSAFLLEASRTWPWREEGACANADGNAGPGRSATRAPLAGGAMRLSRDVEAAAAVVGFGRLVLVPSLLFLCACFTALHCWAWRRVPNGRRGDGRAAGRAFRQVMGIYGGSADALVMALLRRRVASRSCGARDEHGHRAELPPVARERTIMRGVPACVEG